MPRGACFTHYINEQLPGEARSEEVLGQPRVASKGGSRLTQGGGGSKNGGPFFGCPYNEGPTV